MTTPEPLSTAVEAGTEAAVIRDLAQQAVDPAALDAHQIYSLVVPEGSAHEIVDLERFLVAPRRKKGTLDDRFASAPILRGAAPEPR